MRVVGQETRFREVKKLAIQGVSLIRQGGQWQATSWASSYDWTSSWSPTGKWMSRRKQHHEQQVATQLKSTQPVTPSISQRKEICKNFQNKELLHLFFCVKLGWQWQATSWASSYDWTSSWSPTGKWMSRRKQHHEQQVATQLKSTQPVTPSISQRKEICKNFQNKELLHLFFCVKLGWWHDNARVVDCDCRLCWMRLTRIASFCALWKPYYLTNNLHATKLHKPQGTQANQKIRKKEILTLNSGSVMVLVLKFLIWIPPA